MNPKPKAILLPSPWARPKPTPESRAKYQPGEPFESFAEFLAWLDAGKPVYERHKVQTGAWIANQSLLSLRKRVASGWIIRAVRREAKP